MKNKVNKKKVIKKKVRVDGYYFDGKNSFTLYKDEHGKITMKKREHEFY